MKKVLVSILIMLASASFADQIYFGQCRTNTLVVTNESIAIDATNQIANLSLETVANRGGSVTGSVVTIDAANERTNTFGGLVTVLGRVVKAGYGCTVGVSGFVAGTNNTVGDWGFGVGSDNTVGPVGFGAGYRNVVGDYGFGVGSDNTVGPVGFGAGYRNVLGDYGFGAGQQNTIGECGFGAGYGNIVGDYGFGACQYNTIGDYGFGAGDLNVVGDWGFGAGQYNTIGDYGFGAGSYGKGALGSFVFADSENADFDRMAYTNWFSVRASGGVYFATPGLTATGTVTAASFHGSGSGLTGITAAQVGAISTNSGIITMSNAVINSVVDSSGLSFFAANGSTRKEIYAGGYINYASSLGLYGSSIGYGYTTYSRGRLFCANDIDYLIQHNIRTTDAATKSMTIAGQAAYGSATVNTNGGAIVIQGGAPTHASTGTYGVVSIQLSGGLIRVALPTSTNGLSSGVLWNNAGTVSVMP